jgi:putative hemolysin
MQEKPDKFIDIARSLSEKNPRLAKWVPNFVLNYLRRLVHEDQCNEFIDAHWNDNSFEFLKGAIYDVVQPDLTYSGLERIPVTGKAIVIANHPLGGLDGMILMDLVGKVRPDIQFPANDLLMGFPQLRPLFLPINKHGLNTENKLLLDAAFSKENIFIYFPAGLVSRRQANGQIEDLEWKKTFAYKSIETERTIIPAFVHGLNTNWFYGLGYWRKKLGIKFNIEMAYLADEMFKQKGKKVHVTFGKPISHTVLDDRFSVADWTLKLREQVYALKNNPDAEFPY